VLCLLALNLFPVVVLCVVLCTHQSLALQDPLLLGCLVIILVVNGNVVEFENVRHLVKDL
jgi:hypothetical protein